jgi:hypothetical chaperone protein
MEQSCGLDFGTTNSAIGVIDNGVPVLVTLEDGKKGIPSAIFFDTDDGKQYFGEQAISRYLEGYSGRIMWSPKNALGSSLINEKTLVGNRKITFREIIGQILNNVKTVAEKNTGKQLKNIVAGRPVHFNDDDPAIDKLSQDTLRQILLSIGFKNIEFEYEPIAAAIAYEQQITRDEIAMIVDIGGGTSDFTVIKLSPNSVKKTDRREDILSVGGVHVAGTDFDRQLSIDAVMPELGLNSRHKSMEGKWLTVPSHLFLDLATWHKINFLYVPKVMEFARQIAYSSDQPDKMALYMQILENRLGHYLAKLVEKGKIALSDEETSSIEINQIDPPKRVNISRERFNNSIQILLIKIESSMIDVVIDSQLNTDKIDSVFFTGGGTFMPEIRARVASLLPKSRVIDGDKFGSVASGLTLKAKNIFGG